MGLENGIQHPDSTANHEFVACLAKQSATHLPKQEVLKTRETETSNRT